MTEASSPVWRTLRSSVAYENAWIRVREDAVLRPDGEPGVYGVVEVRSPAVFVVPVTEAGEIVLVAVERYTVGRSWEIPAGGTDGEDALVAAARELREEAGLAAAELTDLGPVWSLNGVAQAPGRVVLARGLTPVADPTTSAEQEVEGITAVRTVSPPELPVLLRAGEITDDETLGALLLALNHLGRVH